MQDILERGLAELSLDISRSEDLARFARMMLEKNKVMNLTRITEDADVARLHLLDSAVLLSFADIRGKSVCDVGTGAGFPGMPLRILEDDFDLVLLDSLGKRVDWLRETCEALHLSRVSCVHARAEDFAAEHRESFDLVTSRAVAELRVLSELCLPLLRVGGRFFAMKSVECDEELQNAKNAVHTLGGKVQSVNDYTIPTSDICHRLIIIEKIAPTPKSYPRSFAKIKKSPL